VVLALDNLMAARYQMALSLGFHIVLACFGVALPALIYVLHRRGIRHDDADALVLAKKWAKVSAVLFAVGAVSGTILSFEMGLLWPGLMSTYGDVIGLPFALEGIAFFTEAVFIAIYLYGWGRLSPRVHLNTLIPIMISGAFGTFCIISVNAWMNAPAGFDLAANGEVIDVRPLEAMFNSAVLGQSVHMFVAAYVVTGFLVAAVYAIGMLKGRDDHRHRLGFAVAMAFAGIAAVVQPFVGHLTGDRLAEEQPSKLAAIELATETETRAPLVIGGILVDDEVRFAIEIPVLGSLVATNSLNGEVPGLDEFPPDEQPPANVVHLAFQTMVGAGTVMAAVAVWYWWRKRRHDDPLSPWLLRAVVACGGLAVIALQAGWVTTEVGRQPWIVYQVMRVDEAVTDNNGVWISLAVVVVVYTSMAYLAARVIRGMTRRWRDSDEIDIATPYGPSDALASVGPAGGEISDDRRSGTNDGPE
jgi:cytochrome d ubiquinol oxidase subunit I